MLIIDPFTGEPRLLAPRRALRLADRSPGCPFCLGNESATPLETGRAAGGDASWSARAFPNLFPLSDMHEVLVPTPRHVTSWRALEGPEWSPAMELLLERRAALQRAAPDKLVHAFINDGRGAGASIEHVHAQLVALPRTARGEALTRSVLEVTGCAMCAVAAAPELIVHDEDGLLVAAHPAPRIGGALVAGLRSHRAPDADELAQLLQLAVAVVAPGDFNAWYAAGSATHPGHGYLELVPRSAQLAGVELGLGLGVAVVEPGAAAAAARDRLATAPFTAG